MYLSVTIIVKLGIRILPWTVIEVTEDLLFQDIFLRIKAGCYEGIINVRDKLCLAVLKVVFVGSSKECLSIVSSSASVHGVCLVFGVFLKFEVEVDKKLARAPLQVYLIRSPMLSPCLCKLRGLYSLQTMVYQTKRL